MPLAVDGVASSETSPFNLTVDASADLVVVIIGMRDTGGAVSSVTVGGAAATKFAEWKAGPGISVWYKTAPSTGTVSIAWTDSGAGRSVAAAVSFIGANQTTPLERPAMQYSGSATNVPVRTFSLANDIILGLIAAGIDTSFTAGTDETERADEAEAGAPGVTLAVYSQPGTGGPGTINPTCASTTALRSAAINVMDAGNSQTSSLAVTGTLGGIDTANDPWTVGDLTVASGDAIAIVVVGRGDGTASGITLGGVAMTRFQNDTNISYIDVFYLMDPDSSPGTGAQSVVVSGLGTGSKGCIAFCLSGNTPASPLANWTNEARGTVAPAKITLTDAETRVFAIGIDSYTQASAAGSEAQGGWTEIGDVEEPGSPDYRLAVEYLAVVGADVTFLAVGDSGAANNRRAVFTVSTGTLYTQAVDGALTMAGALSKTVKINLAGALTFVGALTAAVAKIFRAMLFGIPDPAANIRGIPDPEASFHGVPDPAANIKSGQTRTQ